MAIIVKAPDDNQDEEVQLKLRHVVSEELDGH